MADCRNGDRPSATRRAQVARTAQAWEAPSNDIRMPAWDSSNSAVARTAACPAGPPARSGSAVTTADT